MTRICDRHGVPGEADVAAEISLVGNVMHGRSKKIMMPANHANGRENAVSILIHSG